ncbi:MULTISPECIES: Ig-like domain-containing protein [unclassified Pseudomonas]|uniref:Ig-like domain-containing protein n=1 Tax=unclassified Pseudomonas TaxID=196821 RepID=UPI002097C04A|nr:Tc toxin subunit A [Pseudomonas sp. 1]MCO7542765.1 Tc toxin subunit A [Pseudomonas sp. VA159-2]
MAIADDNRKELLGRVLKTLPGLPEMGDNQALVQDSVFNWQRADLGYLMARLPRLDAKQAKQLSERLNVAFFALMRRFREARLSAGSGQAASQRKGLLAQPGAPILEQLLGYGWNGQVQPGAIESTGSPVAWLVDLQLFMRELEKRANPRTAVTFAQRRPDVLALQLDERAVNRVVTQVEVVINMLKHAIAGDSASGTYDPIAVQDQLLAKRYPYQRFPYEFYTAQVKTVLTYNQLYISDLAAVGDIDAPYFIHPGGHAQWSDTALAQYSGLGPILRGMLLDDPYFDEGVVPYANRVQAQAGARFFKEHFGVQSYADLQTTPRFCQALNMDEGQMNALLARAEHTPIVSGNLQPAPTVKAAMQFGARFINSDGAQPVAVARPIKEEGEEEEKKEDNDNYFLGLTPARCDRLNRLIRVANAMQLSPAQADQVLCAAIDAQRRGEPAGRRARVEATPLRIGTATLRALGLFQYLREQFACTAEDFATLLGDIAVYGPGETPSHFDRVFNFDDSLPLVLDDKPFSLAGSDDDSRRTVQQLCRGLRLNMEGFRYLARAVMQFHQQPWLQRSVQTVSTLYRVTLLARLLGIGLIELLTLLEVLSPDGRFLKQLTGQPHNTPYQSASHTDTVSVIHAVSQCVLWCREEGVKVSWLVEQLKPLEVLDVTPLEVRGLLLELATQVSPFRDIDKLLLEAGVPALQGKRWQTELDRVVDALGLVIRSGRGSQDFDPVLYEDFARREIQLVAMRELPEADVERVVELVLGVVLRVRTQQWELVQQSVSQLLKVDATLAVPILYWAAGTVHDLLAYAVEYVPAGRSSETMKDMLPLVRRMQRRKEVVVQFDLSPAMLSSLLSRPQRTRFSLLSLDLTLHTLYFLSRYTRCVRQARKGEHAVLDYFRLIEELGPLSGNELRLVREAAAEEVADLLGWGINEVFDVARQASADGIVRNVAQLWMVARIQQFCAKTGLSAASVMKLSRLSVHDSVQLYREAAQEMLASLERKVGEVASDPELRQSQLPTCKPAKDYLIANPKATDATTITFTLLDRDGVAVSGLPVKWATNLGYLKGDQSTTDHNGVATIEFEGRSMMGVATITATYLLGRQVSTAVTVGFDADSLNVDDIENRPQAPWPLAGNRGTHLLRVRVMDRHDNSAADQKVIWTTDREDWTFRDSDGHTLTDHEGFSTVRLRGFSEGTGYVYCHCPDIEDSMQEVTVGFDDQPYVSAFILTTHAVVGEDMKVRAMLTGLDGDPVAGVVVSWGVPAGTVIKDEQSVSDDYGWVWATLVASAAGTLTVTVSPEEGHADSAGKLEIDVLIDAEDIVWVDPESWPVRGGDDVVKYAVKVFSSDGKPVINFPVIYTPPGVPSEDVYVGPDGYARAQFVALPEPQSTMEMEGHLRKWQQDPADRHRFPSIPIVDALNARIEWVHESQRVGEGASFTLHEPEGDDAQTYYLDYILPTDHPVLELKERVQLVSGEGASAASLGLTFDKGFGEWLDLEKGKPKLRWTITSRNKGLKFQTTTRFAIRYRHAQESVQCAITVVPAAEALATARPR